MFVYLHVTHTHTHTHTRPRGWPETYRLLFQYVVFSPLRRILFAGHLRLALGSYRIGIDVIEDTSTLFASQKRTRTDEDMYRNGIQCARRHPVKRLLCCRIRREKLHWIKIYSERMAASGNVTLKCNASKNMATQPAAIPQRELERHLKKSIRLLLRKRYKKKCWCKLLQKIDATEGRHREF